MILEHIWYIENQAYVNYTLTFFLDYKPKNN